MNLFVYGTLLSETVWNLVVRGDYSCHSAVVSGYARKKVKGEVYPGLLPCSGGFVEGLAFSGISVPDLFRLDAFEGGEYERTEVIAACGAERTPLRCLLYLFKKECRDRLLDEEWSYEEFLRNDIHFFLSSYLNF